MKLKVLSQKGRVVSLGYIDQPHNIEDDEPFDFGPVPDDGQAVSEEELPNELASRPLTDVTVDDFVKRLQANLGKKK